MDPNQQPQPPQPPQFQPVPPQPQSHPQYTQAPVQSSEAYPQALVASPASPVAPPPATPPVVPPSGPAVGPVPAQPFAAQPQTGPQSRSTKNGKNPGGSLGIASFILLFVGLGLVSLILGIIGLKKSKRAGRGNVLAVVGIIGGILEIIAAIGLSIFFTMSILTAVDTCREYGSGTHTLIDGKVITCNI